MATDTRKKTTSKKGASKSGNGKKKKKSGQLTLEGLINGKELRSSLLFVFGVLLLIVALFSGSDGTVWNKIHSFYFAVSGLCGYFIPLAVLFCGVVKVLEKQQKVQYVKLGEVFILLIIICGLLHINKIADSAVSFSESLKNVYLGIYRNELSPAGTGGVVGALFGGLLFSLGKNKILANILSFLFLFADLMFMFGITLFKVFSKMEKPAKTVTEKTGQVIEKTKTDYEKKKTDWAYERARRAEERHKSDVDPAKIVNDFYDNADESTDVAAGEAKTVKVIPRKEIKGEADGEIFSIFDAVAKKYNSEESQEAADAVPENIFTDAQTFVVSEEKSENKKEKPNPLSPIEEAAVASELDSALNTQKPVEYVKPPLDCLNRPKPGEKNFNEAELKTNGEKLISALDSFNVAAKIVDVIPGPTVTRYELSPAPGVKISKFVGLADDLALHLAAPTGLRIEAPIPNKAAIGIEIPNRKKTTVSFREIIDTDAFRNAKSKLNVALGKDIAGAPIYSDLAKMPHLLVAGTTGSGKSVCMNTMIVSLLYNATPDEVKLLLVDPKQVEFGVYNGLPHLLVPVVSDPRKASGALGWAVTEMLNRYKTLNANSVRDIGAYNSLCEEREDLQKMPHIVIFIDELSDLMTVAPAEVQDSIQRLAQMARAAGMHLVVATQRPSVDVITGVIKANIPSRIALTVKSQIDSRTIIDSAGAEKLMGYGDMLYYPVGLPKPIRVQGSYLTDTEIENVVSFIKANGSADYDDNVQQEIERQAAVEKKKAGASEDGGAAAIDAADELLVRAVELFLSAPEKASISALQRHLGLGFAKAGRLMDTLEEKGIVGQAEGSKPRKLLITKAQWYEMNALSSAADVTEIMPDEFESFSEESSATNGADE